MAGNHQRRIPEVLLKNVWWEIMNYKLAGCVILYNPSSDVITNIETYINECDILYIIDNGNGLDIYNILKRKYDNIKYIFHSENMGISYSLNEVLEIIIKNNTEFLLTMDQDSCFIGNSMSRYKQSLSSVDWGEHLHYHLK